MHTQPQQRFLVLQTAACEYRRLSWYLLLDIPVGEESGETEGCIGRLNKLYNFDVNSSWGIRCKDKDTKDEQEWPSLLIPIERRHHGTPLHKKIVCVFQQNNDFLYYLTGIRFRRLHTVWLAVIKTIIRTGNDLSKNRRGSETLG